MKTCPAAWATTFLSAVGAINWGLVAFLKFNLVEFVNRILPIPYLNTLVYTLVAISGIYTLVFLFMKTCATCKQDKKMFAIYWLTCFLSAIGAINWGLTAFLKLNLVEYIGNMIKVKYLKEIIYGLISVSGFYLLLSLLLPNFIKLSTISLWLSE